MEGLSNQTHPKRTANPVYRIEARFAVWSKRLVEGLAGDAGDFCDIGHPASASDIAQRSRQQPGVICFQYIG